MIKIMLAGGNDITMDGDMKLFKYFVESCQIKRVVKLDPTVYIFTDNVTCIRYIEDEN